MAESFDPRVYARQMAAEYGLDPDIFTKMLFAESSFDPNAKSVVRGKDYVGYGQLGAAAAQDVGITDRFDPRQNIEGSAKYLKMQLDEFGSYPLALAAYNAGPQTVRDKGGIPNYPETQAYIEKIMGNNIMNPNQKTIVSQTVTPSSAPVNAPIDIVPEYMREGTPVTPALLRRIREEEAAKVASQAAAPDPNDPYANLSKTQRRMLSFAAIKDAGMALQGLEGRSVENLLSDFTTRADQARKAKAAQQRSAILQNIMGGVGGSGVAGSGMSREAILQLALSGVIEPSMANVMLSEMTLAQEKSEKKQSEIYSGMEMLADIDSLMGDEGLKNIVGIEGIFTEALNSFNLGALRGDAARARSKLNKIKGGAFLKAFESLKGGGQITELEGKKAEQAQSRLETALNYPDFLDALEEFRFYVDIGIRRKNGEQIPPDQIYTPSNRTPTSQNPDVQKRLEERFGG
jgi:hypothetical protein